MLPGFRRAHLKVEIQELVAMSESSTLQLSKSEVENLVCYQKALKTERNLNQLVRLISQWETHMNSPLDTQRQLAFKEEEPADQWEQRCSSTGSPESQGQDVIPPQDQDDPMGEEVVDLWAAEDEEDDVAQQATRSSI